MATSATKKATPATAKATPAKGAKDSAVSAAAAEAAAKFTISSIEEAAKTKGMWAGNLSPVVIPDLFGLVAGEPGDGESDAESAASDGDATPADDPSDRLSAAPPYVVAEIKRQHTPALLKIMDEIIVNATDHAKGQETAPPSKRVTRIDVDFDPATGAVEVRNDGPGIPVVRHEAASALKGRDVYVPEIAFAMFLGGTNAKKDLTNVKGGTNALGAKLANVHSVVFEVETSDALTGLTYRQRFRDRLTVIEPPAVEKAAGAPYTRVAFTPAYASLGYALTPARQLAPEDAADLDAWLRLRVHQAAAYAGPAVAVTYRGAPCTTTTAQALARLLAPDEGTAVLATAVRAAEEPWRSHPWQVAVVVLPAGKKAARRAAAQNMAVVNGVISNKGSHIAHLREQLSAAVEAKLRKATKKKKGEPGMSLAETLGGVRLVMTAAIPGIDWGSQSKDELPIKKATLEHYALPAKWLGEAAALIAERILLAQNARGAKVRHEKYVRARHAGRAATKRHTLLAVAEGDSAILLLKAGLSATAKVPPGGPSFDWVGYISIQGVMLNAAREVSEVGTSEGGAIVVRSAKLQSNERFLALADAFGLRYDVAYATEEERATLNYGTLLLCVDQDTDGTGKIAPIVLVWIFIFWPALLAAGRVGRFMTPLIRAFPKRGGGPPLEFYYAAEFRRWQEETPGAAAAYTIKYYKGLAAHTKEDAKRMFQPEAFARMIYRYTLDDGAKELFNIYYGPSAALRKVALSTPVAELSYEEALAMHRDRLIPVGRSQLEVEAKAYKLEAIGRQIPGVVDGLNPARRKVLMGAFMQFASSAADIKVFQLGGYVAHHCFYHHGDASLNATIITMAQAFVGARAYPYLTGVGLFGTRHGDEAGSPRYIGVTLAPLARHVFPPADRWHLAYVEEDGERAQPRTYVPVLPMALLESYAIVSEGWNHTSFGRDLASVVALVEAYVGGEIAPDATAADLRARYPLPVSLRGRACTVRPYRGYQHSFGEYRWDADTRTVVITDLPIGVTTNAYKALLTSPGKGGAPNPRAEYIEEVRDDSTDDAVRLAVKLRAGAFERIAAAFGAADIDPLEDALLLRESLHPHLNYVTPEGAVLEFGDDYHEAFLRWAPVRAALYRARVERARIVAALSIAEAEAVERYCASGLDLAALDDEERAVETLRAEGYPALDAALLAQPKYTPNERLAALVTGREADGAPCAASRAGHGYLLDLRERDLVRSASAARRRRIETLRADLAAAEAALAERPIPCARLWAAEVKAAHAALLATP